jgi:hypothetical protein
MNYCGGHGAPNEKRPTKNEKRLVSGAEAEKIIMK